MPVALQRSGRPLLPPASEQATPGGPFHSGKSLSQRRARSSMCDVGVEPQVALTAAPGCAASLDESGEVTRRRTTITAADSRECCLAGCDDAKLTRSPRLEEDEDPATSSARAATPALRGVGAEDSCVLLPRWPLPLLDSECSPSQASSAMRIRVGAAAAAPPLPAAWRLARPLPERNYCKLKLDGAKPATLRFTAAAAAAVTAAVPAARSPASLSQSAVSGMLIPAAAPQPPPIGSAAEPVAAAAHSDAPGRCARSRRSCSGLT